jgi:uncharacterized LabA/DUF88 family protein
MTNRVFVYVDGFNLYYRGLKGTPYKWLDLETFAFEFLRGAQRVDKIRYFTARVGGAPDPGAPARQQAYLNALQTLPDCQIHYGSFLTKTARKPKIMPDGTIGPTVEVRLTEEKGSDVNLATHLVNDAHLNNFDVALVLSQDSDLLEPMRIVKAMGKPVGLVWLEPSTPSSTKPSQYFIDASSFIKHARVAHYKRSQFDATLTDLAGKVIAQKPAGW